MAMCALSLPDAFQDFAVSLHGRRITASCEGCCDGALAQVCEHLDLASADLREEKRFNHS